MDMSESSDGRADFINSGWKGLSLLQGKTDLYSILEEGKAICLYFTVHILGDKAIVELQITEYFFYLFYSLCSYFEFLETINMNPLIMTPTTNTSLEFLASDSLFGRVYNWTNVLYRRRCLKFNPFLAVGVCPRLQWVYANMSAFQDLQKQGLSL